MERVEIVAPCSSANLGSGFDVFGIALEAFHDIVIAELTDQGINLKVSGLEAENIPKELDNNTAGFVAKTLLANLGVGVNIHVEKGVPLGVGLGSSGASAAACVVALNKLLKLELNKDNLIRVAAMGEIASAGIGHADNVAASVLGGFTMVQSSQSLLHVVRLEPPENLDIALALPLVKTPKNKTAAARAILPKTVKFGNAIANAENAATLVTGFHLGDVEMIGRGMIDLIVEPVRKSYIPGYDAAKKAASDAGAAGIAISGAGPAVIAFVDQLKYSVENVASAMKDALEEQGIQCESLCTHPSAKGAIETFSK